MPCSHALEKARNRIKTMQAEIDELKKAINKASDALLIASDWLENVELEGEWIGLYDLHKELKGIAKHK